MSKTDSRSDAARQWYASMFTAFEESLNGSSGTPFHATRKAAIEQFSRNGFPTPRDEEWKYTNVAPILQHDFNLSTGRAQVPAHILDKLTFPGLESNLLVLVNGQYSAALSRLDAGETGVQIMNLAEALQQGHAAVAEHLGKYASYETEAFTALNTAFTHDGVAVCVSDGTDVSQTLHILHLSVPGNDGFVAYPRTLFVVGRQSRLKVVESFHGQGSAAYFNNYVSESVLADEARMDHLKLQDELLSAYHVSNTFVHQERNSIFSSTNVDLGGALVRNNLNVRLNGQGCQTYLFGFYLGRDSQHIDNHTFMDHAVPHCFSNELYKGILDDQAHGVFNGKILVRPDAQKTNALQSNKTLLLTNDAVINAKPQLEIFADDVKCTHGATIGQLDDEALFYLRARGITEEMASAMLRHAFISDALANIPDEAVKERLDRVIIEHFTNGR